MFIGVTPTNDKCPNPACRSPYHPRAMDGRAGPSTSVYGKGSGAPDVVLIPHLDHPIAQEANGFCSASLGYSNKLPKSLGKKTLALVCPLDDTVYKIGESHRIRSLEQASKTPFAGCPTCCGWKHCTHWKYRSLKGQSLQNLVCVRAARGDPEALRIQPAIDTLEAQAHNGFCSGCIGLSAARTLTTEGQSIKLGCRVHGLHDVHDLLSASRDEDLHCPSCRFPCGCNPSTENGTLRKKPTGDPRGVCSDISERVTISHDAGRLRWCWACMPATNETLTLACPMCRDAKRDYFYSVRFTDALKSRSGACGTCRFDNFPPESPLLANVDEELLHAEMNAVVGVGEPPRLIMRDANAQKRFRKQLKRVPNLRELLASHSDPVKALILTDKASRVPWPVKSTGCEYCGDRTFWVDAGNYARDRDSLCWCRGHGGSFGQAVDRLPNCDTVKAFIDTPDLNDLPLTATVKVRCCECDRARYALTANLLRAQSTICRGCSNSNISLIELLVIMLLQGAARGTGVEVIWFSDPRKTPGTKDVHDFPPPDGKICVPGSEPFFLEVDAHYSHYGDSRGNGETDIRKARAYRNAGFEMLRIRKATPADRYAAEAARLELPAPIIVSDLNATLGALHGIQEALLMHPAFAWMNRTTEASLGRLYERAKGELPDLKRLAADRHSRRIGLSS